MELVDPIIKVRMDNGDIYNIRVLSLIAMTVKSNVDDYVKMHMDLYVEGVDIVSASDQESSMDALSTKRKLMLLGGKENG